MCPSDLLATVDFYTTNRSNNTVVSLFAGEGQTHAFSSSSNSSSTALFEVGYQISQVVPGMSSFEAEMRVRPVYCCYSSTCTSLIWRLKVK